MIDVSCPNRPVLRALLEKHPQVRLLDAPTPRLQWKQGDWQRDVSDDPLSCDLRGLVEIVDNNPMVCADRFAVPGPAATLALIALAPLARAGILVGQPSIATAGAQEECVAIAALIADLGFTGGITILEGGAPSHCVVLATIQPATQSDLQALFDEAYGRSFFVRMAPDANRSAVQGRPFAVCSMRCDAAEAVRLEVAADTEGKCGAAQLVHAMNVMAGFEEDLGIPERLPV